MYFFSSLQLAEQHWLDNLNIRVPLIQKPEKVRGMFCFYTPKSVNIIGSFLQGTAMKNKSRVDVAVEMPEVCNIYSLVVCFLF